MSGLCGVLLTLAGAFGDPLDEARALVQRGLLSEAEQRLERLLADETSGPVRARAFLLLGNVDYERGSYAQALSRYLQVEQESTAEASVAAAARENRGMADQRLRRSRELEGLALRLRAGTGALVLLAAAAVGWLARRPAGHTGPASESR